MASLAGAHKSCWWLQHPLLPPLKRIQMSPVKQKPKEVTSIHYRSSDNPAKYSRKHSTTSLEINPGEGFVLILQKLKWNGTSTLLFMASRSKQLLLVRSSLCLAFVAIGLAWIPLNNCKRVKNSAYKIVETIQQMNMYQQTEFVWIFWSVEEENLCSHSFSWLLLTQQLLSLDCQCLMAKYSFIISLLRFLKITSHKWLSFWERVWCKEPPHLSGRKSSSGFHAQLARCSLRY